jgi:superfamily II DNA helicase RecQ
MKNENQKNEQSKTNENTNLQTIIVVGECKGTYVNDSVTKEFEGLVLVTARPDGAIVVHNLSSGVRPICYIDSGATVSMARNLADAEIEVFATTEDSQQLSLQFTEVIAMQGVPGEARTQSLAMSILKCVFDLGGKYGRTTIAGVLIGSVSRKVLTINISKLGTYGVARGTPKKEVLKLIDWLLEEKYLAHVEDSEFPTLVVTSKGLDVLAGGGEIPQAKNLKSMSEEEVKKREAALRAWRDKKSAELGKPKYFVLQNKTLRELASKSPETLEDLQAIYGIGEVKALTYGEEILSII